MEPSFYQYPNTDVKHRPDIVFYTNGVPVVTDITVVAPQKKRGAAARAAADRKVKHHEPAVTKYNHQFYPFAVETNGHMDKDCFLMIKRLASSFAPKDRFIFKSDMLGACSTALARFKTMALLNAAANLDSKYYSRTRF